MKNLDKESKSVKIKKRVKEIKTISKSCRKSERERKMGIKRERKTQKERSRKMQREEVKNTKRKGYKNRIWVEKQGERKKVEKQREREREKRGGKTQ